MGRKKQNFLNGMKINKKLILKNKERISKNFTDFNLNNKIRNRNQIEIS